MLIPRKKKKTTPRESKTSNQIITNKLCSTITTQEEKIEPILLGSFSLKKKEWGVLLICVALYGYN
jgi:hypothetical protein